MLKDSRQVTCRVAFSGQRSASALMLHAGFWMLHVDSLLFTIHVLLKIHNFHKHEADKPDFFISILYHLIPTA